MLIQSVTTSLFEPLPESIRGGVGVCVFDPHGRLVERLGHDDGIDEFERLVAATPPGRAHHVRKQHDGGHVVVTFPCEVRDPWAPVVEALLDIDLERRQLEVDLESMSASSLGLLEEVAMVGDVMTELSTGETAEDVIERGLRSLMVAASAERALYFRWAASRDGYELVVDIEYDAQARRGRRATSEKECAVVRGGLVERAASAPGTVVLETVPEGAALGEPGSPESWARRQVVAVPVTHGTHQHVRLLGVLMLLDKRATSYRNVTAFGSHETKMASGLASMLAAVLGARTSAALGKELEMATMIQQQILPDRPVGVAGFDLAGRCETSGAVGGDYFDYLPMRDGRVLCVVADVSGHNLASGMVMVGARSSLRLLASRGNDPALVFDGVADSMYGDLTRTERFITAAAVAIGAGDDRAEIVNAGHNDTMIYRAQTGAVDRLPSTDTILGFVSGTQHEVTSTRLEAGDVLLLYTDGVTEAERADGEMFGEHRLVDVLTRVGAQPADDILDEVFGAVEAFGAPGGDDRTALVVKRSADAEAVR